MNEQPEKPWGMELNTYCLLMHLSQLANYLVPTLGIILPLVMWQANRDLDPIIDQHGKVVTNWLISALIYSAVCLVLSAVLIGILGLWLLGILNIVFVIVGVVKASEGTVWSYPLSIRFLKIPD